MEKGRAFFGIGGLLIGVVVGFLFANGLNRTYSRSDQTAQVAAAENAVLPADHPGNSTTGVGSTQSGSLPQVAQAIERAESQPNNFGAQMTAGDLCYKIQRFSEAAKFYEKADQIKPGQLEPLVKMGNAYFDAEQYESAEKWYQEALKKTPNDTGLRTDLGLTFYLRTPRDIPRAIKEFQTVLAIEPDKEITLQNLAVALRDSGDKAGYESTLARLAQVNPNNTLAVRPAAP